MKQFNLPGLCAFVAACLIAIGLLLLVIRSLWNLYQLDRVTFSRPVTTAVTGLTDTPGREIGPDSYVACRVERTPDAGWKP